MKNRNGSFANKRDASFKKGVLPLPTTKTGIISIEIDKLMKEKMSLLLKNSIKGFLDPPIATLESG